MAKKIAAITVAVLCIASVVSAQSVTSEIFGFQKVDIPPAGGVNMVGFSFTSSTPLYLEDIFGTDQLAQGSMPPFADLVYVWNGSGYDSFFQKDSSGTFYNSTNAAVSATAEIISGTALFLKSPPSAGTTNTIVLSGVVDVSPSQDLPISVVGLQVIANPYPTELDLNDIAFDWTDATPSSMPPFADNLSIWNPELHGTGGYDQYFLKEVEGVRSWYLVSDIGTIGNAVIPAGGGAFYRAKATFTNQVVRPFSL